jgi:hypothetical protein
MSDDEPKVERRRPEQDFGWNLKVAGGQYIQITYPAGEDGEDIRFDWETIERIAADGNYVARCLILARDREIPGR